MTATIEKRSDGKLSRLWTAARSRLDGWQNVLTGIGVYGVDKSESAQILPVVDIDDEMLTWLYDGDDVAARIVNAVVDDSLRQGYEIVITPDEDNKDSLMAAKQAGADVVADLEDRLQATQKLSDAWSWGRLFGKGFVYMLADEGGNTDQSEPLNTKRLRRIDSLMILDRRDLYPSRYYSDPSSPKFGEVSHYRIQSIGDSNNVNGQQMIGLEIHESRLLVFGGARTTIRKRAERMSCDLSVLQRVHDVIRDFNMSWKALSNMLAAASQGVFKMQGLIELIAGGEQAIMQQRMGLVDVQRSVGRSLVMDAENESYEQIATHFTGVPDSLRVFMLRISSAAEMPLTKLMGQSPAGMNATGESDRIIWAETVESQRHHNLEPELVRLADLVMLSSDGPTKGRLPERWELEWPALIHMTDEQVATIRKTIADADKIYLDTGVAFPEEIAISRFGPGGWSMETMLQLEDRAEILKGEPLDDDTDPGTPADDLDDPADPKVEVDPGTAFNGAQVTALKDLVIAAATGEIPRSAAVQIIAASYPLTVDQAEAILRDVQRATATA